MSSISPRSVRCLSALILLISPAASRHIHHRRWQQLNVRDPTPTLSPTTDVPSATAEVATASVTDVDDAIENLQNMQQGLSDLPGDLLEFMQNVDARLDRLETFENMLSIIMNTASVDSNAPGTQSPSTTTTATSEYRTSATTTLSSSIGLQTIGTSSIVSESTTSSQPTAVFRTSRMTSTLVRTITLSPASSTAVAPLAASGSIGTSYVPYVSGTPQGASNWTAPSSSSLMRPATLLTSTRSVSGGPALTTGL